VVARKHQRGHSVEQQEHFPESAKERRRQEERLGEGPARIPPTVPNDVLADGVDWLTYVPAKYRWRKPPRRRKKKP